MSNKAFLYSVAEMLEIIFWVFAFIGTVVTIFLTLAVAFFPNISFHLVLLLGVKSVILFALSWGCNRVQSVL